VNRRRSGDSARPESRQRGSGRRARRDGIANPRGGAVVVAQRLGGAVNLNLHVHALVLDGVFSCESPFTRPDFHSAPPLDDPEVEQLRTLA
jgi:hypothetical protein